MRRQSTNQIKLPISFFAEEVSNLQFLRTETDAASDSEVIRRSFTYLEQFVDDIERGIRLKVEHGDSEPEIVTLESLGDGTVKSHKTMPVRTCMLNLNINSYDRIKTLMEKTEAVDISQLKRMALRLSYRLAKGHVEGADFYKIDAENNINPIKLEFMPTRPGKGSIIKQIFSRFGIKTADAA